MDILKDQLNWAVFKPLFFVKKNSRPYESTIKYKNVYWDARNRLIETNEFQALF
jgi:hypothetical protein